jgi:hypothetical protein
VIATLSSMWQWIIIVALYALGCGTLRLLGGVGAAGDALRDWGEAHASKRLARTSSSS